MCCHYTNPQYIKTPSKKADYQVDRVYHYANNAVHYTGIEPANLLMKNLLQVSYSSNQPVKAGYISKEDGTFHPLHHTLLE